MTTATLMDDIANAITRLRYLETKSNNDDETIKVLTRQKDDLAQDLADAQHNFGVELFQMQQERDAALARVRDVQIIIETLGNQALTLGKLALAGDARIKSGDEQQGEVQHNDMQPPLLIKHLQPGYAELPQANPDTPLPPQPTPMDEAPLFLRGRELSGPHE